MGREPRLEGDEVGFSPMPSRLFDQNDVEQLDLRYPQFPAYRIEEGQGVVVLAVEQADGVGHMVRSSLALDGLDHGPVASHRPDA